MVGSCDVIALEKVVGPDTNRQQPVEELFYRGSIVVDACKQDRLITDWNSEPRQLFAGCSSLGRDLPGMVEVGIDPEWSMFVEKSQQIGSKPHRQHHRLA